jgi:tetratricopeptide (TPR) repeat protein
MLRSMPVWVLLTALALPLIVGGCAESTRPTLDDSVRVFLGNDLSAAAPMLAGVVKREPDNADAHAWYAECLRRQGDFDRAYEEAVAALTIDTGNSFAHTVLGDLFSPRLSSWDKTNADSAWSQLMMAVEADPGDGNAWSALWIQSVLRGDAEYEHRAAVAMIESGFLTPSVLAYNRWQLEHLPPNAILLTNGDMDTYPSVALQEKEGLRQDVAVINRSLLNMPSYLRSRAARYGLPLPFPDQELDRMTAYRDIDGKLVSVSDRVIGGWIDMQRLGELDRPLCAAITLSRYDFTEDAPDRLVFCGAYYEYVPLPAGLDSDIDAVRESLASLDAAEFDGPFASDIDRSPVRRSHTDELARNVTACMLRYAGLLLAGGRADEAMRALDRAERFDAGIRAGGTFTAEFDSLRADIGARM